MLEERTGQAARLIPKRTVCISIRTQPSFPSLMCSRIWPCLARPMLQDSCAAAQARRVHPPANVKANRPLRAAAEAAEVVPLQPLEAQVPEAAADPEEQPAPLPHRRPALPLWPRRLLEPAV